MAAAKQKGTTTDLREALTTVNADQPVITDDVVTGNSNEMTPAAKLLEALGMPTLPTKLSGICDDDSWSCVMREEPNRALCGVVEPDHHSIRSGHCRSGDLVDDHRLCTEPAKSFDLPQPARDRFNQCAGAHHHR